MKYFDNLIFGERLAERKKKKKYELVHKRHIRAFIKELENWIGKKVGTGIFGADMKVELLNDGPVTIVIDTKNRE